MNDLNSDKNKKIFSLNRKKSKSKNFENQEHIDINNKSKLSKLNGNSHLFNMILTSMFMALFLISSYLTSLIHVPIVQGYSIPFELIFYVYSIILIRKVYFKVFYFIFSPLIALSFGGSYINPLQTFFEYLLVYYVFFPFLFVSFLNTNNSKRKKNLTFLLFIALLIICCTLKFLVHFFAGVIWWTPSNPLILGNLTNIKDIKGSNWISSAALNAQYVYVGLAFYFPIAIAIYYPVYSLNNNIKY